MLSQVLEEFRKSPAVITLLTSLSCGQGIINYVDESGETNLAIIEAVEKQVQKSQLNLIILRLNQLDPEGADLMEAIAMKPEVLEQQVVIPTLELLAEHHPKLNTPASVTLMMGTIAQESDGGKYNWQIGVTQGKGAVGICQVEYATEYDIRTRYIPRHPKLLEIMDRIAAIPHGMPDAYEDEYYQAQLESNQSYCVFIARLKYWMRPDPMPANDIALLAEYWDTHYNANPNYGTPQEFIESYRQFVEEPTR